MDGCTPELMRKHESRLSKVEESLEHTNEEVGRAHKRMDNLDEFKTLMLEMNGNIKVIAEQIKNISLTVVKHDDDISSIKERMETKETVGRLHGKVEELEHMYNVDKEDAQVKQIEEFKNMKKFITKIMIGAAVFVATSLIIFAVIILIGMANAGALPTGVTP